MLPPPDLVLPAKRCSDVRPKTHYLQLMASNNLCKLIGMPIVFISNSQTFFSFLFLIELMVSIFLMTGDNN